MSHKTGTRQEWLEARLKLLEKEKELTRKNDELARARQDLPWVKIDKNYQFDTEQGKVSLKDLFQGRSQLLIYHFMFGPDYTAGCPSCSSIADSFNGIYPHLMNHDVMFWAVSRAPLKKLKEYEKRMGWTFPWASSTDSDFNFDYSASITKEAQENNTVDYNFRREKGSLDFGKDEGPMALIAGSTGTDIATYTRERPGMSAFILDNNTVYHTYSAYARGLDALWGMYPWLDRAPKGRNESDFWVRRHDEYESAAADQPKK